MADQPKGFLSRFAQLEIPEEVRSLDWTFLNRELSLPPLPLLDRPLLVLVNSRVLIPQENEGNGARILFYREWHALSEPQTPAAAESAWKKANAAALAREAKRFWDGVPASILREDSLIEKAQEILRGFQRSAPPPDDSKVLAGALPVADDPSAFTTRLTGRMRLLRIHEKLYDLVTLREYVRIFEKAIEPALFRSLQGMPETTAPETLLERIEGSLDAIHSKARSPLRNKLLAARVVVNDVTLLPIYREPAAALFDAYRHLLESDLKLQALAGRGRLT